MVKYYLFVSCFFFIENLCMLKRTGYKLTPKCWFVAALFGLTWPVWLIVFLIECVSE